MAQASHFILYVKDPHRSTAFYSRVLALQPRLNVPGMTEFALPGGGVLGLMPESSIARLFGHGQVAPAVASGGLRAELYLVVDDPAAFHARALAAGARELSPLLVRDWGHSAAYSEDGDGHVLAFAAVQDGSRAAT